MKNLIKLKFFVKNEMEKNIKEKEKEKNNINKDKINNFSNIYTCNNCLIVPEINNINYSNDYISLKCPFHNTKEITIEEYLNENANRICSTCNKSNNSFYYCYQCKKNICIVCKNSHINEHNLININEYNIKCQIHYNKRYLYYCYNCSSNLCEECHLYHDNNHNITLLSSLFPKNEELDYITNKNIDYNRIIEKYSNYIKLNNLILYTYKNFSYNFYYIKNLKNIIRYQKNLDINNNIINNLTEDLEKQNKILENFNEEFETELTKDTQVIYLNWKNIYGEALENLSKIEFCQMKEFQSVGTNIDNISFFKNAKFPQLQELYLTDNDISDISVLENVNFELLKIIYLNKNKIVDINVFKKVKFRGLIKLFLDNNYISDISVFKETPLTNLENINVSRNKIINISVLKKINLVYLRILNIKKNRVDYSLKENIDIINDLRDKSIRIIY